MRLFIDNLFIHRQLAMKLVCMYGKRRGWYLADRNADKEQIPVITPEPCPDLEKEGKNYAVG
ncbi:hypothetical protein [Spirosoma areae]